MEPVAPSTTRPREESPRGAGGRRSGSIGGAARTARAGRWHDGPQDRGARRQPPPFPNAGVGARLPPPTFSPSPDARPCGFCSSSPSPPPRSPSRRRRPAWSFRPPAVEDAQPSYGLAVTLLASGRVDEATALLEDLHQADPSALAVYLKLGEAYVAGRRYDALVDVVERRVAAEPGSLVRLAELGAAYHRAGRADDARRRLGARRRPPRPTRCSRTGWSRTRSGNCGCTARPSPSSSAGASAWTTTARFSWSGRICTR